MGAMIAYAEGHKAAAQGLVDRIRDVILDPLITLLLAIAVLVFLWGAFQYVYGASNGNVREEGRQHMLWGVIGLLVMLSAYAILRIAAMTVGVQV